MVKPLIHLHEYCPQLFYTQLFKCTIIPLTFNQLILRFVNESLVKKKYGKLSNFMNIGKKKVSSLESPDKALDTSGSQ